MSRILLKGGILVSHQRQFSADLLIVDGQIAEISKDIDPTGCVVHDVTGLYVLPGVIDAHVHFRDPGHPEREDWNSGSRAAVRGGTTTVFDMPNTNPPTINAEAIEDKLLRASQKSLVNYGIYGGATPTNAKELYELRDKLMGVKIYMGSSTGDLLVDKREWLEEHFKLGVQIVVHAENEALMKANIEKFREVHDPGIHSVIRGNDVAAAATQMAIEIGKEYNTKLHIAHMSTKEELLMVKNAKVDGYSNLTCEVCPHHLLLNTDMYEDFGTYLRVNPPIRSKEDVAALWQDGLSLGVVDMIATDHAPHLRSAKEMDYWDAPSGMPGVQECLTLMLANMEKRGISLEKIVELTSFMPAKIFGLKNRGQMKEGMVADLVVVDLNKIQKLTLDMLETRCEWSNYLNWELKGWPVMTFVNGNLVWNGETIDESWRGKHITKSN